MNFMNELFFIQNNLNNGRILKQIAIGYGKYRHILS